MSYWIDGIVYVTVTLLKMLSSVFIVDFERKHNLCEFQNEKIFSRSHITYLEWQNLLYRANES